MGAIVIDKNVLQGNSVASLRRFCNNHIVLLPHVLLYEICSEDHATTGLPRWLAHMRKLQCLEFRVCRRLPEMFAVELERRLPIGSIVDDSETRRLRQYLDEGPPGWASAPPFIDCEDRRRQQDEVVGRRRDMLKLIDDDEGAGELIRQVLQVVGSGGCRTARALATRVQDITRHLWQRRYPEHCRLATDESVVYMDVVLRNYQEFRRATDGHAGMAKESLFNEALDRDYIVLLCRADGLVSNERAVRETAQAFFPQKLVWEDLRRAVD